MNGRTGNRGPDPSASFRFRVKIAGVSVATFQECSAISVQAEIEHQPQGGRNSRSTMLPKAWKWSPITLKRGIASDGAGLWDWVMKAVQGVVQPRTVTVTLCDVSGAGIISWDFEGAYPTKWSTSTFTARDNSIVIEELSLAHQGVTMRYPG